MTDNYVIKLRSGEVYLTENEDDAFLIQSGCLLIYAVSESNNTYGKRSFLYEAKQGETVYMYVIKQSKFTGSLKLGVGVTLTKPEIKVAKVTGLKVKNKETHPFEVFKSFGHVPVCFKLTSERTCHSAQNIHTVHKRKTEWDGRRVQSLLLKSKKFWKLAAQCECTQHF